VAQDLRIVSRLPSNWTLGTCDPVPGQLLVCGWSDRSLPDVRIRPFLVSSVKFARRLSLDAGGNRHAITMLVYDRGMPVSVNLESVHPRKLAAVRREVAPGAIGSAWGPALDKVWEFIRSQPGLRTDGHNIFLYHHPIEPGAPILCDFGVEVTRTFETAGEVYATETQGGEAAVAVHCGPYNRMNEAHDAIRKWMAANRRESAGHSWEIYGDPMPDPASTETTIVYLLK
jgi:effector-binding domain-containing protein